MATWCKELTHWKRHWCWERLRAGGEEDDWGWEGWMASSTQWTWIWVNSGNWWWTGRPGVLQSMGLQRVWHDWLTELNWTDCLKQNESWPIDFPLPGLQNRQWKTNWLVEYEVPNMWPVANQGNVAECWGRLCEHLLPKSQAILKRELRRFSTSVSPSGWQWFLS